MVTATSAFDSGAAAAAQTSLFLAPVDGRLVETVGEVVVVTVATDVELEVVTVDTSLPLAADVMAFPPVTGVVTEVVVFRDICGLTVAAVILGRDGRTGLVDITGLSCRIGLICIKGRLAIMGLIGLLNGATE